MSRFVLPSFAAFVLLAYSITASGQDLKEAARLQKVAAQKLTDQVGDAIDFSRKQDPTLAKFALQEMLRQVRDSQDLLESQRTPLVQKLQARIRTVDDSARAKNIAQDQRPAYRDPDRPKFTKPASDPSGGLGSVAKNWTDQAKGAQKTQAELIREREKNRTKLDLGIEQSAVLNTADPIEFPPYWKELTERRKKMVEQQLTKKEVALLKALNSVMTPDYDNEKFKAVINHLQEKTGLTIIVDEPSLNDLMLDYDAPVTFKLPVKVSVRAVLKKILGDKGLTYIIKEGAIQVMTPKKAAEHTVVRAYQIDDLVAPSPQMQMMFGPFIAQAKMMQNAQQLINLIQATIEPNYWQPNGPGTIAFFAPTKSLLIRASAEMHYQLGSPGMFGGR
jgi:hypothetical protein